MHHTHITHVHTGTHAHSHAYTHRFTCTLRHKEWFAVNCSSLASLGCKQLFSDKVVHYPYNGLMWSRVQHDRQTQSEKWHGDVPLCLPRDQLILQ